jgi:hypothetical protein
MLTCDPSSAQQRFAVDRLAGLARAGHRLRFAGVAGDRGRVDPRRPEWGRVSRASSGVTAVRNCTRDEGRPFGFGDQEPISSHRKLLRSKAVVVSVAEKLGHDPGRYGRHVGNTVPVGGACWVASTSFRVCGASTVVGRAPPWAKRRMRAMATIVGPCNAGSPRPHLGSEPGFPIPIRPFTSSCRCPPGRRWPGTANRRLQGASSSLCGPHPKTAAVVVAGMAGRYPDSYLDRCDGWRAAAILD